MKKTVFLFAGLLVATLAFSSCKKAWDCNCNNGVLLNGAIEKSATVFADTHEDAYEKCQAKVNKKGDVPNCHVKPN